MLDWSVGHVLAALAAVLASLYLYSKMVALKYWERRGVPHLQPVPFVGSLAPVIFGKMPFYTAFRYLTEQFKQFGYCGAYVLHKPVLFVWDPEMAKQILVKEFSSFHDRCFPFDKHDPFSANLFMMRGRPWRNLRSKMSPTFTSGKLKLMFPLMREVSGGMINTIRTDAQANDREVEVGDVLHRFAVDVIGTCAFGIVCNSLQNAKTKFLLMAREVLKPRYEHLIVFLLRKIHIKLPHVFPFSYLLTNKPRAFFMKLMRNTVEHRQRYKVERNDFVDLMMKIQASDSAQEDQQGHIEFSDSLMTAQAVVFFTAGMENISITLGFCLHHLAHNAEVQRRAAEEVRAVLKECDDGQMTYESLRKMDLVGRIVMETLRLWPPNRTLLRECNEDAVIGNLTVKKGEVVLITVENMHMNPDVFPEPTKFDPDRFLPETVEARHSFSYLPFGEGPRICIAERFAMVEMKMALASLLDAFEFTPGPSVQETPDIDERSFNPKPKRGVLLNVVPRDKEPRAAQ